MSGAAGPTSDGGESTEPLETCDDYQIEEYDVAPCTDDEDEYIVVFAYPDREVRRLRDRLAECVDNLRAALEHQEVCLQENTRVISKASQIRNILLLYQEVHRWSEDKGLFHSYTGAVEKAASFCDAVTQPLSVTHPEAQTDVEAAAREGLCLVKTSSLWGDIKHLTEADLRSPDVIVQLYELMISLAEFTMLCERTTFSEECLEMVEHLAIVNSAEECDASEGDSLEEIVGSSTNLLELALRASLTLAGELPGPDALLMAIAKSRLARQIIKEQLADLEKKLSQAEEEARAKRAESERKRDGATSEAERRRADRVSKINATEQDKLRRLAEDRPKARLEPMRRGTSLDVYINSIKQAAVAHISDPTIRKQAMDAVEREIESVQTNLPRGKWSAKSRKRFERNLTKIISKYGRKDRRLPVHSAAEAKRQAARDDAQAERSRIEKGHEDRVRSINDEHKESVRTLEEQRKKPTFDDEAFEKRWKGSWLGGRLTGRFSVGAATGIDVAVAYFSIQTFIDDMTPKNFAAALLDSTLATAGTFELATLFAKEGQWIYKFGGTVTKYLGPVGACIGIATSALGVLEAGYKWYRGAGSATDYVVQGIGLLGAGMLALSLLGGPTAPLIAVVGGTLSLVPIAVDFYRGATTSAGRSCIDGLLGDLAMADFSGAGASSRAALDVLTVRPQHEELRSLVDGFAFDRLAPLFAVARPNALNVEDFGLFWKDVDEACTREHPIQAGWRARSDKSTVRDERKLARRRCIAVLERLGIGEKTAQDFVFMPAIDAPAPTAPEPADTDAIGIGRRG